LQDHLPEPADCRAAVTKKLWSQRCTAPATPHGRPQSRPLQTAPLPPPPPSAPAQPCQPSASRAPHPTSHPHSPMHCNRYRWTDEKLACSEPAHAITPKPPKLSIITYPFTSDPVLVEHVSAAGCMACRSPGGARWSCRSAGASSPPPAPRHPAPTGSRRSKL
jgi:hypothetical protein